MINERKHAYKDLEAEIRSFVNSTVPEAIAFDEWKEPHCSMTGQKNWRKSWGRQAQLIAIKALAKYGDLYWALSSGAFNNESWVKRR